jgi:hypothetical protein
VYAGTTNLSVPLLETRATAFGFGDKIFSCGALLRLVGSAKILMHQ